MSTPLIPGLPVPTGVRATHSLRLRDRHEAGGSPTPRHPRPGSSRTTLVRAVGADETGDFVPEGERDGLSPDPGPFDPLLVVFINQTHLPSFRV